MHKKKAVRQTEGRPRLAYIRWVDAAATNEWEELSKASSLPLAGPETVGWIIGADDEAVRVAATCDFGDMTVGNTWAIPKVNVIEIVYLDSLLEKLRRRKK